MTRVAVLGSPVGHSLSPVLHRAAYEALGLDDWSYTAIECREHELARHLGPGTLFDVVYAPWPTRAARAASARGARVVSGLSMPLHQAVAQVSRMTGRDDVPPAPMRLALTRAANARTAA